MFKLKKVKLLFSLIFLASIYQTEAINITVSNLNDTGLGSLRQAITDVNSSADLSHTIGFSVTGMITLTANLPTITQSNVTINGNSNIVINANAANNTAGHIFRVEADFITIKNFDLKNIGHVVFRLVGNLNNLVFENINISNDNGDQIDHIVFSDNTVTNFTLKNIDAQNQQADRYAFEFKQAVTNLNVTNCNVHTGGGSSIGFYFLSSANNINFTNTIIDCDADGIVDDANYGLFFNGPLSNVFIDNLTIHDAELRSIYTENTVTNFEIRNSKFDNFDGYTGYEGIRFKGVVNNLTIYKLDINLDLSSTEDDGERGILFISNLITADIKYLNISNGDLDGIYSNGILQDITIDSSNFSLNEKGIDFLSTNTKTNIVIKNSTFANNSRLGLQFSSQNTTTQVSIENNSFYGSTLAAIGNGIRIHSGVLTSQSGIEIIKNSIYNNIGDGIYIERKNGVHISKNNIYNNKSGINLLNTSNYDYTYLKNNTPVLFESKPLSGTNYSVTFNLPSFCTDCNVDFFRNDSSDTKFQGREYLASSSNISAANNPHTITLSSNNPSDFWTSTVIDNSKDQSTSNHSFHLIASPYGPGGVSGSMQLWMSSDKEIAANSSDEIQTWNDRQGVNPYIIKNGTPKLLTSSDDLLNFNPVTFFGPNSHFRWDGNSFMATKQAGEIFSVAKSPSPTSTAHFYDFGGNSTSHYTWTDLRIYEDFGSTERKVWNPTSLDNFIEGTSGHPPISSTVPSVIPTNYNIYNTSSQTNDWRANFNGYNHIIDNTNTVSFSGTHLLGTRTGAGTSNNHLAEVIIFDRVLEDYERTKITSYLAMKYGQTIGHDYMASDWNGSTGTKIWELGNGFDHSIITIGRDDNSSLYQKQSKSSNIEAVLSVSQGLLTQSNALNPSSFLANLDFLAIGNNGGLAQIQTTDIPTSGSAEYRLNRIWKATETGTDNTNYTLAFDNIPGSAYDYELYIDNDGNSTFDIASATTITGGVWTNGQLSFNGVDLNSDNIFTIGYKLESPGGVLGKNTNGLAYTMYDNVTPDPTLEMPVGSIIGRGYFANLLNPDDVVLQEKADNFTLLIEGEIEIDAAATGNYIFSAPGVNDYIAFWIDGNLIFDKTSTNTGANPSGNIVLTAGRHNLKVIFAEISSAEVLKIQYTLPGSGSAIDIPDDKLFVDTKLGLWLDASTNLIDVAGEISTWTDKSVSINKFTKSVGNAQLLDGSEEISMNSNPSVELSADEVSGPEYSNGMVVQNQSRTLYTIIKTKGSGTIVPFSTGRNSNSNLFGIRMGNYHPNLMGFSNDVDATSYSVGVNSTSMVAGIYENTNLNGTDNAKVYVNGKELLAASKTNWLTHLSPTEDFNIGGLVNGAGQLFDGSIAEVLLYPWNLDLVERTKVETYLALKYGISLDQTVQKHYTASDGSLIWDMNANTTFNYGITGIGRDDKSGLNQKQSKSTDNTNQLKIGLGSFSASNPLNSNAFTANLDFLIWGHNNGSTKVQNTGLPSASNAEFRYGRTWKINEKGTNHTNYSIVFDDIPGSAYDYELMIDTDGDDDFTTGTPTIITTGIWDEGTLTFNNIDLNSGNTVTVGFNLGAPGGLTSGNTNGIHYKLYDAYTEDPSTTLNGNLVSEGYLNNLENLHLIVQGLQATQYTFDLETDLEIDVTEDYTFTASGVDDRLAVWIDDDLEITLLTGSSSLTSTKTLVAGKHKLKIRLGNNNGGSTVTLKYSSPTITTAINIPDDKLFVDANISLWYNAGSLVSNTGLETNATTWKDFSINQNNVTNVSGTPTYFDGSESTMMNFNPSIDFQGNKMFGENYTFGLPYGKQSRTLFSVVTSSNTSENAPFTTGLNANNSLYGLSIGNYRPGVFGFNQDVINTTYFISPDKASILSGIHENFKINPTLNGSLYHNGKFVKSNNQNLTTRFNNGPNITIGGATDATNRNHNGRVGEIIYFPWKLNVTDINKVETYLSIKYGITKDQTTPTSYLASDGSTIWNATTFAGYKTNIAGIGYDEKSILHQKQSKSVNTNSMLTIGLGSIENTNALNTNTFSADKSFLIWGSNGERNSAQTIDNPSPNVDYRISREWKVSEINNETNYTIQFELLPLSSYEHELFIDTDGDGDFSTGTPTVISGGTMVDGKLVFTNVDLQHGDVFTVGFNRFAPGGVVVENANGIHYSFYNGYSTDPRTDLNGDLLSEGYIDNFQDISNFFTTEFSTNFTIDLEGEIDITEVGNHTFTFSGIDAGAALWIDDILYIHKEPSTSNLTHTANLTVGKHKLKLRFTNEAGGSSLDLKYSTPSNATLAFIPDDKLFVNAEIGTWFSANTQVNRSGNGTDVTDWKDLSANRNNVTTTDGTPTFSSVSSISNFNPVVNFNADGMEGADYSSGMAFSSQERTVYTVMSTEATNTGTIFSHGNDQNNILFNVQITGLKPTLSGWNTHNIAPTASVKSNKMTLISGIFENPAITATNNSHIYQNSELLNSETRAWRTRFNDNEDLKLGRTIDRSDRNFNGTIAEVVYFPWKLSVQSQTKVETYLALKYGLTLDQTVVQNYIASNNSILWNTTTNTGFNSNIVGIGRDDKSGYNQKQSKSTETNSELTLGLGSIETTNALNTNTFSTNISYLVCGNNGEKGLQNSGLPTGSTAEYRMKKVWKVTETGSVPSITLEFNSIPSVAYNIGLFVDTDNDGDFTNATVTPGTLVNGKLTFTGVSLNTNDQFTVGYSAYSPGGVLSGMSLWLKADVGLKGTIVKNGGFTTGFDNWLHSGNQVASGGAIHFNSGNSTPNGILSQNIETVIGDEYTFSYRVFGHNTNNMLLQIEVIDSLTNAVLYSTVIGQSKFGVNTAQITPTGLVTKLKITDVSTATNSADVGIDDIIFYNQSILATKEIPDVVEWENQINFSKKATQSLVNEFGEFNTNSRNYNPGVTFDGNDHYNLFESFIDDGNTDYTIVSVQTPTSTKEAQIVFLGTETTNNSVYHQIDGSNVFESSWTNSGLNGGTVVTNNPDIYVSKYNNTTGRTIRQDGTEVATDANILFNYIATIDKSLLGRHTATGSKGFEGDINEVVIYNNNTLSPDDLIRIETYMAIKYGITLPYSYYASDWTGSIGTSLWASGSGYDNDIAAIGRDDLAQLNQKQSKSANTDDIVAIGLDTVYATNLENTNTFASDKTFLAWGNNNSGTGAVNLGIPSLFSEKTARTWKTVVTSTVDSVLMQISDTELQAIGFTPNAEIKLFIADDDNFTSNIIEVPLVLIGDNWQAKVKFAGTQFFSFGVGGAPSSNIHFMRHGKYFDNGVKQPMKF